MIRLSKNLSYILRHGAEKHRIPIRPDGYMLLDDLLKDPKFRDVTLTQIQRVVENNDKKRFTLTQHPDGTWMIRANQGHSMETVSDLELVPLSIDTVPETVVHGTTRRAWGTIRNEGLCRMGRLHIHFAVGLPGEDGVISGMRGSSDVLIYVDVKSALQDGVEFFRSSNNVVLCPGVGEMGVLLPKYFSMVTDRKGSSLLN
ncbi:phosphotransferase KptA/Tpt1 [Cladochytrium replicatum]|nr:phosphotransferase KptA/Tpt1 [Cladochytrium replicatum]